MRKVVPVIVIGLIAAAASGASYFFTQHVYAEPICRQAGAQPGWRYVGIQPPDLIISGRNRSASNVTRDAQCVFADAQGRQQHKSIRKLSGSFWKDALITLGLQLDLSFVIAAAVAALLWMGFAGLFSGGNRGSQR